MVKNPMWFAFILYLGPWRRILLAKINSGNIIKVVIESIIVYLESCFSYNCYICIKYSRKSESETES